MKARFIQEIGMRVSLRIYWEGDCPNSKYGYHNATKHLRDTNLIGQWNQNGNVEDYSIELWPLCCDNCKNPIPVESNKQVHEERLYNTDSGRPEPGDLYFMAWPEENYYWDNHKGPHLHAVLPTGELWNIDSRASNCTMPNDRNHRCWVRHGEPPNIHVDKNGNTCQAGAGSILVKDWHGFLHHGEFHT